MSVPCQPSKEPAPKRPGEEGPAQRLGSWPQGFADNISFTVSGKGEAKNAVDMP